jgi:hypothetical protein
MFAAKIYQIPNLKDLLKTLVPHDVSSVCCVGGLGEVRVKSDAHKLSS